MSGVALTPERARYLADELIEIARKVEAKSKSTRDRAVRTFCHQSGDLGEPVEPIHNTQSLRSPTVIYYDQHPFWF